MRDIRGVPIVRIRESVHIQCTFRVIVSMTKTFYVSYSDINLSIHAPPLIAVKLEPIMYSTDIKWKMLRRRKKKKTFEDLKKSLRTRILPWLYGNGFTCNNQIFLFEILQIKWSIDKKCELIKINQLLFFGKKIYLLSRWFSCLGRVLHIAIHTHVPYPLCACSIGDFLSRASKYLV